MGKVIRFPRNRDSTEFYKFILRYEDGAEFKGATLEEAFCNQKDYWEPEISMVEYLERMRDRLLFTTGCLYKFTNISELISTLESLNLIEVGTYE